MNSRKLAFLSLMLVLVTILPADAQPQRPARPQIAREGRWEFSLQTRYTASRDYAADNGSKLSFKDSLGWGFGFGYNLSDQFNLGLAFGWRRIPYQATVVDATDPASVSTYGSEMSASSLGLSADWNILPGRFTPYVNGRLAWLLVDTNIVAGISSGCWWDPWWGYVCGNVPTTYGENTGAYGLGVGGRFEVSESFFVRVGYEHGWTGIDGFGDSNLFRVDLGLLN